MSRLVRWDPFREMVSVRNQMDQLVGDFLREPNGWPGNGEGGFRRLALDVYEDDNGYSVTASMPGIEPDELDISFSENTLTIQGETQAQEVDESAKWHVRERHFGRYMRSITLPAAVNADSIGAAYEDGVLTLTLPKADEVKPRRIAVQVAGEMETEA
ncbi:MAG: Hsp20/alpha crystallin family protein [Caldilineaceae bacterium]|nr:Hsp20/alpha crystallin family protein [Caldilineaceae bacterium]MCY4115901.1 Hsp20/alpha crystallin family protein [Caldilineaceae bacterium]MDE0068871.1 Hsp20/alpha crystallin family protein [Caldilineaceae bacterium]MDE0183705.1 Hsp20/alpha crystallin family protein [Caldilineaceae bacterium]